VKPKRDNYCEIIFEAKSENISFARVVVTGFLMPLDPTIDQLNEMKTIVSEAVTNCIVHAYADDGGIIKLELEYLKKQVTMKITDYGRGIDDIYQAKELFFTTKPNDERSGMGITLMEVFSDEFEINSIPYEGTTVTVKKSFDFMNVVYAK
jgi:stage II sporulation protein AB (anti-sigma F factor)